MTEQIYASNTPTIDIHIVMGTGSPTDPHIDASIPLDTKSSEFVRDTLLPTMETLRSYVDEAEMLTSQSDWPFPSYGQLLFSVS